MIDVPIEELLVSGLAWVCIAAWRALPLLCIVLVFDLLLRRRIAARFHCLLWMIVAARMLCPFSVESSLSLHRTLQGSLQPVMGTFFSSTSSTDMQRAVDDLDVVENVYTYQNEAGDDVLIKQTFTPEMSAGQRRLVATETVYSPGPHEALIADQSAQWDIRSIVACVVSGIWLFMAVGFLLRSLVQSIRFSWRLRRSATIADQAIVDQVLRACDAMGVGRRPVVKEVDGLTVPAMFGIRRPTICLPTGAIDELSSDELRLILLHEIAHVKRKDGLVLSLCLLMRSLHWFNPLAWLVVSKIRTHMEQAADDMVLCSTATADRANYGQLLLRYASQPSRQTSLAAVGLLFTSPGRALARRITMLDDQERRNHPLAKVFAIAAVGFLAISGLTDAKPMEPECAQYLIVPPVQNEWQQFGTPTHLQHADPQSKPVVTDVSYEVSAALAKIRETEPGRDAEFLLKNLFSPDTAVLSGDQLTVTAAAKDHERIKRRLAQLEMSGHWLINLEARFIQVDLDHVTSLDVDWKIDAAQSPTASQQFQPLHPDSEVVLASFDTPSGDELAIQVRETAFASRPVLGVKLTQSQTKNFMRRCVADKRSTVMFAPQAKVFNGATACISDELVRPFLTGVHPPRADDDDPLQPIVDVFHEGIRLHLRGDVTEDDRLSLRCALTLSALDDVALANLPFKPQGDSDSRVTVQVPKASSTTVHAGAMLNANESLLLASPTTFTSDQPRQKSHSLCILITPRWSREKYESKAEQVD